MPGRTYEEIDAQAEMCNACDKVYECPHAYIEACPELHDPHMHTHPYYPV